MREREAGYSILEVIAAMALLAITLLAGAYLQQQQSNFRASTSAQIQGRKQMTDVMTLINDNPERFPYMEDAANNPVVYVGCFSYSGQQLATLTPIITKDWLGSFAIAPANPGTASGQFNGLLLVGGNPVCTHGAGGWEMHVYPNPNVGGSLQIAALALPNTDALGNIVTNLQLSGNSVFRSNIALRAPAAALVSPFAGGHFIGYFCRGAAVNIAQTSCLDAGTTTHCEPQQSGAGTMQTQGGGQTLFFCY